MSPPTSRPSCGPWTASGGRCPAARRVRGGPRRAAGEAARTRQAAGGDPRGHGPIPHMDSGRRAAWRPAPSSSFEGGWPPPWRPDPGGEHVAVTVRPTRAGAARESTTPPSRGRRQPSAAGAVDGRWRARRRGPRRGRTARHPRPDGCSSRAKFERRPGVPTGDAAEVDKVAVAPRHAGAVPGDRGVVTSRPSGTAAGESGRTRPSSRPRSRGTWPERVAWAAPALPRAGGEGQAAGSAAPARRRARVGRAAEGAGAELRAAPRPRPLRRGAAPA